MTSTTTPASIAAPAHRTAQQERVDAFASDVIARVSDAIAEHGMTYEEYDAVKQWLIRLGAAGEWPLFLDVWFEHTVEQLVMASQQGSKGTILGPYYLPDSPILTSPAVLPQRSDEPGEVLILRGQVRSLDGTSLNGAMLDIWQADSDGKYSGFYPGTAAGNLRARVTTDDSGCYEIQTVIPGPYMIPTGGPCGELVKAAGWSAWRPAHLHLIVNAPLHQQITTQLFFENDPYLDNDVASAVKPELLLQAREEIEDGERRLAATYDFVLDPAL